MEFYRLLRENTFNAQYAIVENSVVFLYGSNFKFNTSYHISNERIYKNLNKSEMIGEEEVIAKLLLAKK